MHHSLSTPCGRPHTPALLRSFASSAESARPARRRSASLSLLALVAILAVVERAAAAVAPKSVTVTVTSADYPDMAFVLFRTKERSSEPDPATARIGGVLLHRGQVLSVLGVPKDLVEKSNGKIDPAWLQKTTPGVLDLGVVVCPLVFQTVGLHYRLDKTDSGPTLTLVNKDELEAAKKYPGTPYRPPSQSSTPATAAPTATDYSWLYYVAGGVLLVVLLGFLILNRRTGSRTSR